ncbi:ATP-binding protein [Kiritimatiella glycovorans]|uniref:ATP-binding protein n=1 Tax=Kiritimatiella glycovorans TaxID=1307763 RepID=UPI00069AAD13|nr:AAA family ATPase [Kiritimatiella glycovorans]
MLEATSQFPAVALSGVRQAGKSTLLKHLFQASYDYVTLDDTTLRTQARRDPVTFLRNYDQPLIIDEVQYAPQLLPEIKRRIDEHNRTGQFILSGSQPFHLIRNLQESLAGRVLLMELFPMTVWERSGRGSAKHWLPMLLEEGSLTRADFSETEDLRRPEAMIRLGGLPGLLGKKEKFVGPFFESYLRTYIERDLSLAVQLEDASRMIDFMRLLAPLTMREINKSRLGRDIGMSPPSAQRWLQSLETGGVWHKLPAYSGNQIKRIAKRAKGTLFDTGLICHLLQVVSRESLLTHPMLGFLFESAVFLEMRALVSSTLSNVRFYHWRSQQQEVDLVLECGGKLFAFECKWNALLRGDEHRGLLRFRETYGDRVAFAGIITSTGHFAELEHHVYQIPWIPAGG